VREEDRQSTWLLVAILALAAILRFIGSNNSLWFDEIVTVREYVREPLGVIVAKYNAANNHVMNSVLAHFSVLAFGEQPWAIRLPAVLFGIGGVWAFALVARTLWRWDLALLGTVLFAVSYHHVYYSQEARGYSAFVFFALLSGWSLIRLLDAPSPQDARFYGIVYALSLGFGTWSLLLMVFVIAGQAVVLLAARRFSVLPWMVCGVALAGILYAPMAGALLRYHLDPSRQGPGLMFFLGELRPVALPLLVAAPIGALLALRLLRRAPLQGFLLLAPIALNIVVFPFVLGVSLHPRTFIYALPIAYLLLLEAFDWCLPRFEGLVVAIAGVVAAGSLALLWMFYPLPKQAFQEALDYVAAHRRSGDRVVGLRLGGRAARFYDPSVVVAENLAQTQQVIADPGRTWILLTFRNEMRNAEPSLDEWVEANSRSQVRLRGTIGDGDVEIRVVEKP
jgi:hypothetical protein